MQSSVKWLDDDDHLVTFAPLHFYGHLWMFLCVPLEYLCHVLVLEAAMLPLLPLIVQMGNSSLQGIRASPGDLE